jgi:hypothetical protein
MECFNQKELKDIMSTNNITELCTAHCTMMHFRIIHSWRQFRNSWSFCIIFESTNCFTTFFKGLLSLSFQSKVTHESHAMMTGPHNILADRINIQQEPFMNNVNIFLPTFDQVCTLSKHVYWPTNYL